MNINAQMKRYGVSTNPQSSKRLASRRGDRYHWVTLYIPTNRQMRAANKQVSERHNSGLNWRARAAPERGKERKYDMVWPHQPHTRSCKYFQTATTIHKTSYDRIKWLEITRAASHATPLRPPRARDRWSVIEYFEPVDHNSSTHAGLLSYCDTAGKEAKFGLNRYKQLQTRVQHI